MVIIGYVRLSRDEDRENYSSIETQKQIINECSREYFNQEVSKFYIDDNYSGYSFDRPDFNLLKKDLDKIDVIIAKDLSRIGRHNARVLLFIEEIQGLSKRLLLPQEGGGYDSLDEEDTTVGISTWINEKYVKDVSRNVKKSIKVKQRNGSHLIRPHLGYMKNPTDKHNLVVNEEESWIVKLIFEKYLEGMGSRKLVNYLTEKNIQTPSEIMKQRAEKENKVYKVNVSKIWTAPTLNRIITNDMYIGTLRLGKTRKIGIRGKSVDVDKSENYIFENNHEGIISKEDFKLAQRINDTRKKSKCKGGRKNNYLFTGLLWCADCGRSIMGHTTKYGVIQYLCPTFHNRGKQYCDSHRINESKLLEKFVAHLNESVSVYTDIFENTKFNKIVANYDSVIKKLNKNIINTQNELQNILMQKIKDISRQESKEHKAIMEKSYNAIENEKKNQLIKLNNQIDELKDMSNENTINKLKTTIDIYNEIIRTNSYTHKQLNAIINKIVINKKGTIEIELNNDLDKLNVLENSIDLIGSAM